MRIRRSGIDGGNAVTNDRLAVPLGDRADEGSHRRRIRAFKCIGRGLDHRVIHDALPEVGDHAQCGVGQNYFLSPIGEAGKKKARSRRDRAKSAAVFETMEPAIDKSSEDVVIAVRVDDPRMRFVRSGKLPERRVHQHHIVVSATDVDKGEATGGVSGEKAPPKCVAIVDSFRVVLQRSKNAVFSLIPELVGRDRSHVEQSSLFLLLRHEVGEQCRLLRFWSLEPLTPCFGNGCCDLLIDLQECSGLTGHRHFLKDDIDELAEHPRLKIGDELAAHILLAGHRFCGNDV